MGHGFQFAPARQVWDGKGRTPLLWCAAEKGSRFVEVAKLPHGRNHFPKWGHVKFSRNKHVIYNFTSFYHILHQDFTIAQWTSLVARLLQHAAEVNATSDHGSPLTSAVPSADADVWGPPTLGQALGAVENVAVSVAFHEISRVYIYIYVLYVWDNYICRYYIHVYTVCIIYIYIYYRTY